MNNLDTSTRSHPQRRSPQSAVPRHGIQEEPKLGDGAGDDDDERSASEDVELNDLSDDALQDDEETGLTGKDKGRRKRKRRRNILLDQRIVGDVKITAEEKKEADQNVVKKSLINGLLIGLWYLFSLSISIVCPPPPS
jgi:solute carrier family 35 protein C2